MGAHVIVAWHRDEVVAVLTVLDGEVGVVEVRPDHRRRGLATALYRIARAELSPFAHSESRSADGQAWYASLDEGDPVPLPSAAAPTQLRDAERIFRDAPDSDLGWLHAPLPAWYPRSGN